MIDCRSLCYVSESNETNSFYQLLTEANYDHSKQQLILLGSDKLLQCTLDLPVFASLLCKSASPILKMLHKMHEEI